MPTSSASSVSPAFGTPTQRTLRISQRSLRVGKQMKLNFSHFSYEIFASLREPYSFSHAEIAKEIAEIAKSREADEIELRALGVLNLCVFA